MPSPSLRSLISFIALATVLSSCAVGAPRRVPFNEAELSRYRGAGSGTISGEAVVTGLDGVTHYGIQDYVTLLPVTAYTKEMVDRTIVNAEYLAPSDPRFHPYVRRTTTHGDAKFTFDHVPPGEYFVVCLVDWPIGDVTEYQWACERVSLGKGQNLRIRLSTNLQVSKKATMLLTRFE